MIRAVVIGAVSDDGREPIGTQRGEPGRWSLEAFEAEYGLLGAQAVVSVKSGRSVEAGCSSGCGQIAIHFIGRDMMERNAFFAASSKVDQ